LRSSKFLLCKKISDRREPEQRKLLRNWTVQSGVGDQSVDYHCGSKTENRQGCERCA
jgi:hypothetical protein